MKNSKKHTFYLSKGLLRALSLYHIIIGIGAVSFLFAPTFGDWDNIARFPAYISFILVIGGVFAGITPPFILDLTGLGDIFGSENLGLLAMFGIVAIILGYYGLVSFKKIKENKKKWTQFWYLLVSLSFIFAVLNFASVFDFSNMTIKDDYGYITDVYELLLLINPFIFSTIFLLAVRFYTKNVDEVE